MNTEDTLPTVEQLATLAAALARTGEESPDTVAKRAMALWRTSQVVLRSEERNRRQREAAWATRLPPVDCPKDQADNAIKAIHWPSRFPIPADSFAGVVVPRLKGRTGDASDAIKGWLWWIKRWRLEQQHGPMLGGEDRHAPEVEPEVDRLFADWRKGQLSKPEFGNSAPNFALWYAYEHAGDVRPVKSQAGKLGANTRWLERDAERLAELPAGEIEAQIEAVAKARGFTPEKVREAVEQARTKHNRKRL